MTVYKLILLVVLKFGERVAADDGSMPVVILIS